MRWLAAFSIRNGAFVHMLVLGVILIGVYSYLRLPRQLMSELAFNWVFIRVDQPGVPADDIEQILTVPMENALENVDGISSITNRSKEGYSFFSLKFEQLSDEEFDAAYQDVKDAIATVDFPADAREPFWVNFSSADFVPMLSLVLAGDLPKAELFEVAEDLRDEIESIDGISKVDVGGVEERQIWVEVDPDRLAAARVPIEGVVAALRAANVSIPGGLLTVGGTDYLLRTTNQFDAVARIGEVVLGASPGGGALTIADVATVADLWEEPTVIARYENDPAVTLTVSKKPEGNALALSGSIQALVDRWNESLDGRARVAVAGDSSKQIELMLGDLQSNALFGMVLVVAILWVFLGLRNAVMTALGIPLAFLCTFIFMLQTGASLDGNSLFGLVLVLGMLVDDAIVLVENTTRHRAMGKSIYDSVVDGVSEVAVPVIAAVATTVAAFLPLMLMPGLMGKFMRIIPIVVSAALIFSLIEALISLPAHLYDWGEKDTRGLERREARFQKYVRPYVRALRWLTIASLPRLDEVLGWRRLLLRGFGWIVGLTPLLLLGAAAGAGLAVQRAGPTLSAVPGAAGAPGPLGAALGAGLVLACLLLASLIARQDLAGRYGLPLANLLGVLGTGVVFAAFIPGTLFMVFGLPGAAVGGLLVLGSGLAVLLTGVARGHLRAAIVMLLERARTLRFSLFSAVYLGMVPLALGIASQVDLDLFSGEEIPQFFVHVRLPEGTALAQTDAVMAELDRLSRETIPPSDLVSVTSHSGFLTTDTEWFFKANYGQLTVQLTEARLRHQSVDELMALLRPVLERVPGPDSMDLVPVNRGPPTGGDVELKLQGPDLQRLEQLTEVLADELRAVPGVRDVRDDFDYGKKELRVTVDPQRAALHGVSEAQVGLALRAAYEGTEATSLQDDGEDVPVIVRYPAAARGDLQWLERTMVSTRSGGVVPFREVAELAYGRSIDAIRRYQGERTITMTANVDKTKNTAINAVAEVKKRLADFSARFPDYSIDYTGEFQEFQESLRALSYLGVMGLLLVYLILGAQFGSFTQPVIIIGFTFPGALLGSVLALLVTGSPLSILTLYGLVALLGIVVNDGLVLISFINDERARGLSVQEAILSAGALRLRPILLTTSTTVCGLLPMVLGIGGKSAVWAPLASTIVFGLMLATATTLLVIPPVYRVLADLLAVLDEALGRSAAQE